jgi:hypothetical protein
VPDLVPSGSEPLPSQRPPSPEAKLSPIATIALSAEPGLAAAGAAAPAPSSTIATRVAIIVFLIPSPPPGQRRSPAIRASKAPRSAAVKALRESSDTAREVVTPCASLAL